MSYFAAHFEEQLKLYKKQVGLLCLRACLEKWMLKLFTFTLVFACINLVQGFFFFKSNTIVVILSPAV